jgi:BirA family biotin operon repressor/biotin-[acetyl-CoA-carboxylase] ligase
MNNWQKIIELDSVNSTNDYTSNKLRREKLPEGTIICTKVQTAGKGLGSNTWESESGKNLLFSLVLYPDFLEVKDQFLLSKAISLGIAEYCDTKTTGIKIKWPNDIYFNKEKLAGILIENSIKGTRIERSIIGIGLNLNQEKFISNAPNPISLKQIIDNNFEIPKELELVREHIQTFYNKLRSNLYSLNNLYTENMFRFNQFNLFKTNSGIEELKIVGVNEFGYLQTISKSEQKKEFDLKEIEFIL